MGDRANIKITDGDDGAVWLYSHWGGTELWESLRKTIRKNERWTDTPYFTRMVFCDMVAGNESESTGFGISTCMCDNEYPVLAVDTQKQTVTVESESGQKMREYSFKDYAELESDPRAT